MKNPNRKNAKSNQEPNKSIYQSHHSLAPGAWLPTDEISLFGGKKKPHPTLSQYDGEPE